MTVCINCAHSLTNDENNICSKCQEKITERTKNIVEKELNRYIDVSVKLFFLQELKLSCEDAETSIYLAGD